MSTAVITDSTATLPAAVVAEHGIRVVPLQLVIDGGERIEGDGVERPADRCRGAGASKNGVSGGSDASR